MAQETDDFLAHYGVLGMKWGRRRGSLGDRIKGAALDRNQQRSAVAKRAVEGRSTREEKFVNAGTRLLLGKQGYNKAAKMQVKNLAEQRVRIEKGKTTLADKLETAGSLTLADLVVSRRDNKG